MNYLDPSKRHEFVVLFDVTNGNPNGDPDAGNLPRVDPETNHGLVTDVCLKRKVRDYIEEVLGKPIFIQSETALNSLITQAAKESGYEPPKAVIDDDDVIDWLQENPVEELELDGNILTFTGEKFVKSTVKKNLIRNVEGDSEIAAKLVEVLIQLDKSKSSKKLDHDTRKATQETLLKKYFDIRMFGAVLSTGLNAGQVRGPVQMTFARSIDPIYALDFSITRVAITKESDKSRKETEMGRKPIVPYGLYRAHGFFNPYLAEKTGVSEEDLKDFWESLCKMFEFDRSASRGEMTIRGLYIFTHENKKGNAPAHKLFELITVKKEEGVSVPRNFSDYKVIVQRDLPPEGIKLHDRLKETIIF
ncbi:MAG TPA: type I-C CRISPR-associated protein Cas7/Csd2 [archaeon]|nr:type I-C CRISPR-associated protein Cas7/Csd2 [archaeon]